MLIPEVYAVECSKCYIRTGSHACTEAEAITAWNRAMGAYTNSIVSVFSSEVLDFRPTERTAKVEEVEKPNVFKCSECGQYFHSTAWGSPVEYCSRCGARLEWNE